MAGMYGDVAGPSFSQKRAQTRILPRSAAGATLDAAALTLRALDNVLRRMLGITAPWVEGPASDQARRLAAGITRALTAEASGDGKDRVKQVVESIDQALLALSELMGARLRPRAGKGHPWSELRAELLELADHLERLERLAANGPGQSVTISYGQFEQRLRLIGLTWEIDDTDRLAIKDALADRERLEVAMVQGFGEVRP